MILSDNDIEQALADGRITITPDPRSDQIQPASLDLRMGEVMYDQFRDELVEAEDGTLSIQPWTFYLGTTLDEVWIAEDLTAQMTGRSSFGREGLVVHLTAGFCDPDFEGELTLEMFNFSLDPIDIEPGERVAQLVFMETKTASEGYTGQYAGQRGPTPSHRSRG